MSKSPADDLANLLADYYEDEGEGGLGPNGDGWRIFIGFEPDSLQSTITVYDTGGESTQLLTEQVIEDAQVMIRVRGPISSEVYAQVDKIIQYMRHTFNSTRQNLGDNVYLGSKAYGSPFYLGKDTKGRFAYSLNFTLVRQ